jgi:hypothetical protein
MPEHLRRDLERNFAGGGHTDASDPDIGGFLNNPGHDTATIAILVGGQLQQMQPPTPSGIYLGGAPQAQLALQVDNAINNTCLVLAFELIETGQVLLFVGDAQIGNWQSWMGLEFTVEAGNATRKVSAKELLARTVFNKVGHHGSGNATLRAGLEAMTSEDLVACGPH